MDREVAVFVTLAALVMTVAGVLAGLVMRPSAPPAWWSGLALGAVLGVAATYSLAIARLVMWAIR